MENGGKRRKQREELKVVTCNCTAWSSLRREMLNNKALARADIILIQEHKRVDRDSIVDAKARLQSKGLRGDLAPAVREKQTVLAVGRAKAPKGEAHQRGKVSYVVLGWRRHRS